MSRFSFEIATAMRQGLRGYNTTTLRADARAGLVVSLVSLPLAMALSIAVGLPPQHGLYTAIVAGVVVALLGGSLTQVSGPTAAFVVIVAPIVSEHGVQGIIWCQLLAGIWLLVMGAARLGRYISFVPYPVTTGFTAGIAVVIATLALNDFLGLGIAHLQGSYLEKLALIYIALPALQPYEALVGTISLLAMLLSGKILRIIPAPIVGVAVGTLLAYVLHYYGVNVATIGSRFSFETAAGIQYGIPPFPPMFHLPEWPGYDTLRALLLPSLVIAALAALESLLSATVADGMAGTRHNPNAELNGIGIGNIVSGLVAGVPATGAIARTSTNIHSGAKTPIASVINALLIMLYVLFLSSFINVIPMAALAALLISVAYRMSHFRQCVRIIEIAPASDVCVLAICFLLTVFVDMVVGVSVGMVLAALLFMKRISDVTRVQVFAADDPQALIFRVDGPLFFGTVEKCAALHQTIPAQVHALVFDLEHVPLIDMSGLVAIKGLLVEMAHEKRRVVLCGKPDLTDRIMHKIRDNPVRQYVACVETLQEALSL